ncbi:hypothetical protein [Streptomyces glomeratus]|uniref:Uncharacterized protein n=1 Tax=Streptomyces glomeratus TaxID=284452 RepID=A0ABP6L684_9ACTN|nr:hypothetical protein [Streptomyces glomeratus]MCF1507187.1 hypothetical protein [Streptomyces glomeratus]
MGSIKHRSLGAAVGTAVALACASPATAAGSGRGLQNGHEEVFRLLARSTQTTHRTARGYVHSVDINATDTDATVHLIR